MRTQVSLGAFDSTVTVTMKGMSMLLTKIPTDFVSIDLSGNKFEGEIPNVIGELHALKGLNLSHNRLSGLIPQSMGNLTNLESLDLSSNMLNGRIPTELTNLNFLSVLNLSHNYLVGEYLKENSSILFQMIPMRETWIWLATSGHRIWMWNGIWSGHGMLCVVNRKASMDCEKV